MGSPEFAVPHLEHLILNQYQVVAVYTQPDRPAGRGRALAPPPVKRAALAWGLSVVQPASLREAGVVGQLTGLHPDVIVVAAFGQILPRSVLGIPRFGCINVHPSLLPGFRGASPVASAILAGDEFTGVSIMLMDEGLDTGPILARAQIPVSAQDTTGSLTTKLSLIGARLLQEVLSYWSRGELTPQPQNEAKATYSGSITKEQGEIDWHLPAIDIWRRVRAFHPWPGCYTTWRGRQLKIIEAVPLTEERTSKVGQVVALTSVPEGSKAAFGVYTGDGVLGVSKVQLEGKRAISAAEFLKGQREFIGAVLP
ncbi:MAG: methionyl-tRNA formyltransferase [Dehalococcoidia bacterium]|nr:methionyl-tRNA formyltransferase [Dehalococcoidia bacterium]MBL7124760.1 methionyl-tRNA formyltransferase [Dehalococcoidales bacterium]